MKIIFIAVSSVMFLYVIVLQIVDSPANNTAQIIVAIGSVIGIVGGIVSPFLLLYFNKKINGVAKSVDGLLEQKTLADKAIGRVDAIDTAAKEKAIADARELQVRKEQDLLNTPPPGTQSTTTTSDVKDVKNTLETEIRKQGDKIQEAVKDKADEIKTEVPEKTADKVVDKLDTKDKK